MKRLTLVALLLAAGLARAQMPDPEKVQIKATPVAGSVTMLEGAGGNIGVSAGDDGVFLIDDQFAPLARSRRSRPRWPRSRPPLRFIFNTHWHFDHTGGNEADGGVGRRGPSSRTTTCASTCRSKT